MAIEISYNINNIQDKYNLANKIPIFATQEYADYLLGCKNIKTIWFIEKEENEIAFMIPLAIKRILIFKKGYFITAVNNFAFNSTEKEKKFLEDVLEIIIKNKLCDWIEQPPNWALFQIVPSKSIYCAFGTYRTDLENHNENELFSKLKHDHRRQIKKAIDNNVIIKSGPELIEDCSKVFNAAASGGNNTLLHQNELIKVLKNLPNNIKIYIAYQNTIPKSCVIFYLNNYCLYAVYSGLIPSQEMGINHLLFWQAIKDAKQNGIKYFDFVGALIEPVPGSKIESIQRFKKHFGGEFVRGFLWKLPVSETKYLIYNILIRTYSYVRLKKYRGDIIDKELKRR